MLRPRGPVVVDAHRRPVKSQHGVAPVYERPRPGPETCSRKQVGHTREIARIDPFWVTSKISWAICEAWMLELSAGT